MLAVLGDLIEDLVVVLGGPIQLASDTESTIVRRRGGSAANVASTAARLGHPTRFLGQVGSDPIGRALVNELSADGVDTGFVTHDGSTGTIVVLVDEHGERSMLTDRKSSRSFGPPERAWLADVDTLHVPLYSFADGELASTARTLVAWAREDGIAVSIDASSVALIETLGIDACLALIGSLAPDVLLANQAEASLLGRVSDPAGADRPGRSPAALVVVKRGAAPALLVRPDADAIEVPAIELDDVRDSTAAGDAFAAGFLTADWRGDPEVACRAGHAAAAEVLRSR